tara:strand:- start:812 stop:1012 length:201 start_codon:yes stop_codon:yes gene_type:complete
MKYKAFVRGTSNKIELEDKEMQYMINLPPHVIEKMGWNVNQEVLIKTVVGSDVQNYVMIEVDEKHG